jgi:hypothetical protein
MTELAKRSPVQVGAFEIEGFMLADGSYRMSQSQAAECIGLKRQNVSDFLRSKAIKRLLGEGFTCQISNAEEIEISAEMQSRGQSRFRAMPLEAVIAYWQWQSHRGNKIALSLCVALSLETLERRFDAAFGIDRSEKERDERLTNNLQTMERYLKAATDYEAEARYEVEYYRDSLRQLGYDPDDLPLPQDHDK